MRGKTMEEKHGSIPYYAHEGMMARMERTIKRLWVLCIILIALLAITNGAWIWYENQFEEVVTTSEITQDVTQESDENGSNTFVGGDMYGETKSETNSQNNDEAPKP